MIVAIENKNVVMYQNYSPDYFIIMLSMIVIFFFVFLSFKTGDMISIKNKHVDSFFWFWFYGMIFIFSVLLLPSIMASLKVNALIVIVFMLFLGYKSLKFTINHIYNVNFTQKHQYFLTLGVASPLIIFSFLHELGMTNNNDTTKGMAVVGCITIIFFIYLGLNIFRREISYN